MAVSTHLKYLLQEDFPRCSNSHIDLCISCGNMHMDITIHDAYVMNGNSYYLLVNGFIIIVLMFLLLLLLLLALCVRHAHVHVWVVFESSRDVLHFV